MALPLSTPPAGAARGWRLLLACSEILCIQLDRSGKTIHEFAAGPPYGKIVVASSDLESYKIWGDEVSDDEVHAREERTRADPDECAP